jgi:hypothetical protein
MFAAEPGYYLESNFRSVAYGTPACVVGDSGVGAQPVPYALIERLAAEHFSLLNFGVNGLIDTPNGGVPAAAVLGQPRLRRLRASIVIDTYAIVDGWPGQYGAWMSNLFLPGGVRG